MKNSTFSGRMFSKKPKNREDYLKRGLGQLADLIKGLAKKKERCFEGGDTPMHTMDIKNWSLNINQTNN